MRFARHYRPSGPRPQTARRQAAARRAIQHEQDKTPLFPTFFYNETVTERITRIDAGADASTQAMRDFLAGVWRRARRTLRTFDADDQALIVAYWNDSLYPKTASYFADLLHRWPTDNATFLAIMQARRGLLDWRDVPTGLPVRPATTPEP